MVFTDEDLASIKDYLLKVKARKAPEIFTLSVEKGEALLARLEAAEAYRQAHPCAHKEPHGALNVMDLGCQYNLRWRKASGKGA